MLELQTNYKPIRRIHTAAVQKIADFKKSWSPKTTTNKTNTRVSATQRRPAPIYEIQSLSLQLYHLPMLELQTTLIPHIARCLIVKNLAHDQ